MPFEKGRAKTGGRIKGQITAKTRLLQEIFDKNAYNPVQSLLNLIPQLEPRDAAKVHLELMQYIFPKLREPIEEEEVDVTPDQMDLDDMKRLYISGSEGLKELKAKIEEKERGQS